MTEHPARQNYQRLGPDDCWPWLGRLDKDGYGMFGQSGKAHRAAYEDQVGPIPAGMSVLHRCDYRACCNGAHLFPGTQQDNLADMVAKKRHALFVNAKLTPEQVRAVREDNRSSYELGRLYGLDRVNICRIKRRETYRSVE
jgi:HNH endonuclease